MKQKRRWATVGLAVITSEVGGAVAGKILIGAAIAGSIQAGVFSTGIAINGSEIVETHR
jgi:hypothetical protein